MDKLFVPYHLAVKMKEIGFQELCLGSYYTDASENNLSEKHDYREQLNGLEYHPMDKWGAEWEPNFIRNSESVYYVSAPTWGQAFDWIRAGYYWTIKINQVSKNNWSYTLSNFPEDRTYFGDVYDTYKEAEISCLEKLIEIIESKSE